MDGHINTDNPNLNVTIVSLFLVKCILYISSGDEYVLFDGLCLPQNQSPITNSHWTHLYQTDQQLNYITNKKYNKTQNIAISTNKL